MDGREGTLAALYSIVKEHAQPEQYHCTPRELILHSTFDWELINKHLELLQVDGMVTMQHGISPSYCITQKGIAFVKTGSSQAAQTVVELVFDKKEANIL